MAARQVFRWRGNNRKNFRQALRQIDQLRELTLERRQGRDGTDYLGVTVGGQLVSASLLAARSALVDLLNQEATING